MGAIRHRALISVYDKEGVAEFGRALAEMGFEIVQRAELPALRWGSGCNGRF